MKKYYLIILLFLFNIHLMSAKILYVDKNGGSGIYTTIQSAINKASAGDTVKIMPGTYAEQITISSDIVVQGSSAETTIISGSFDPVVKQSAGKIMWVTVTSNTGNGINISAGQISNVIILGCKLDGISSSNISVKIYNTISINNKTYGCCGFTGTSELYNCISLNNCWGYYGSSKQICHYCLAFNNSNSDFYTTQDHCIQVDPLFKSGTFYRLDANSPCIDAGDPTIFDPDGTTSDIGYYGGPDAPLLPYLTSPIFQLNEDGTMQFLLKGKVGY